MDSKLLIFLLVLTTFIGFTILTFNRLIRLRNQFKNAFAQIDVQLKRRYELIPNLVETAKKFMKHERETLESVIQARNQAQTAESSAQKDPANAGAIQKLVKAESGLSSAMGRLMAVFENYPDLKSDQTMMNLMEELASTENRVSFSRSHYNNAVMDYNTAKQSFPALIIAGSLGFQNASPFEIENPNERAAVQVKFD